LDGGVPCTAPARRTTRRLQIRWIRVAGLLVVIAAIAALSHQWPASPSPSSRTPPPIHVLRHERPRALGVAGGAVPDGTTVFDDGIPGVAKLDSDLLRALRRAATDAGIRFSVDSGWRSPEYQEQLLRQAISKYGSEEEATRWVATPETSAHVKGDAVDIGPSGAAAWLSEHGAAYGLCRIYGNEPWHYELRRDAGEHGCPALYADPTHDPRMRHE
jgi:D-alanyl-D-alanine carboxypeptidase